MAGATAAHRFGSSPRIWILLGVILGFVGISVPALQFAFPLFSGGSEGSSVPLLIAFGTISAVSTILYGLSGFFILEGIARVRPDSRPLTSMSGVLVLTTSAAAAVATMAYFGALENSLSNGWVLPLGILQFALRLVAGGAFLTGLYGIGRVLVLRP